MQVRKVALERVDALEAMQRQVYAKKLRLKSAQEALRNHREELARKMECVVPSTRTLQIAFKAEADAQRRLQVMHLIIQPKFTSYHQAMGFDCVNVHIFPRAAWRGSSSLSVPVHGFRHVPTTVCEKVLLLLNVSYRFLS